MTKSCVVEGCGRPFEARGYCEKHYARFKRHGAPTLVTTERLTDLTGLRFHRLLVLRGEQIGPLGKTRWHCRCDCGNEHHLATTSHLMSGNTKSCGCLKRDSEAHGTHLMTGTPEHRTWIAMKKRCGNSSEPGYHNYGGRGITVCPSWLESFETFMADMGPRPEGTSLDRINNSKGYSKANCRWATRSVQNRNKRSNRLISAMGQTLILQDWAEKTGINRTTIAYRINNLGWSAEKAVSTPAQKRNTA